MENSFRTLVSSLAHLSLEKDDFDSSTEWHQLTGTDHGFDDCPVTLPFMEVGVIIDRV